MSEVEIFVDEKPQQAAARYYELAKKHRAKAEGAKKAIRETEKAIAALVEEKRERLKALEREKEKVRVREPRRKKWFEAFRWFRTSTGFLVVAGRDAQQNEVLYTRHLAPEDFFFHADVAGAPATIVKTGRAIEELDMQTRGEAAQFAASYSKAWKLGLGSCDVYYVRPEQVSKYAHGQYLAKGAFMIKGERNWIRGVALALLISEQEGHAIALPANTATHPSKSVRIVPGRTSKRDCAERIKKALDIRDVDEIIRCLPGDCDFI